jgi:hypothetical protein
MSESLDQTECRITLLQPFRWHVVLLVISLAPKPGQVSILPKAAEEPHRAREADIHFIRPAFRRLLVCATAISVARENPEA